MIEPSPSHTYVLVRTCESLGVLMLDSGESILQHKDLGLELYDLLVLGAKLLHAATRNTRSSV